MWTKLNRYGLKECWTKERGINFWETTFYSHYLAQIRSFIKRQMSGTSSDNEGQRMTTSGAKSDNEWYNEWQRVTTNGKRQRMTKVITSYTTSDNEWQQMAMSDNKWQWVTASDSSGTTNENGIAHFKEWMIVILSMSKTDTLLLQGMDGCN